MHVHIGAHHVLVYGLSSFVFLATAKLLALRFEGNAMADAYLNLI